MPDIKTSQQAEDSPANLRELPPPERDLLHELNEAQRETREALEALGKEETRSAERLRQMNDLRARLDEMTANPFLFALNYLGAGEALDEAGAKMQELSKAVADLGEKGTLSVTLEVKRMKDGQALVVTPDVKMKKPQPGLESALFFATEDGHLQRNDPRQRELTF